MLASYVLPAGLHGRKTTHVRCGKARQGAEEKKKKKKKKKAYSGVMQSERKHTGVVAAVLLLTTIVLCAYSCAGEVMGQHQERAAC